MGNSVEPIDLKKYFKSIGLLIPAGLVVLDHHGRYNGNRYLV